MLRKTHILVLCLSLVQAVASQQHDRPQRPTLCTPFGPCEPCPEEALHEPFCKPFGNRRLMHCTAATQPRQAPPPNAELPPQHHTPPSHTPPLQGKTPAWESCGRIPEAERADFWEFIACNVFFAAISLGVLFARSKRLRALRGRQLAARIGLGRGSSG